MSQTTNEINKITGGIISISIRLIIFALVVLFLYEGITRGYEFGHQIFYDTSVAAPPGTDKKVVIKEGTSTTGAAKQLKKEGLIVNEYAFIIQAKFFGYGIHPGTYTLNTSMTSKEMLQAMNDTKEDKDKNKDKGKDQGVPG